MSFPLAPWHLWGTSQTITRRVVSSGRVDTPSNQLAKIQYGRPDTWTFLFGVQFESAPDSVGIVDVFVDFDLIIGIGRSTLMMPTVRTNVAVQTPGFARFLSSYAGAGNQLAGSTLWTSQVQGPAMTTGFTPLLDKFPAEEIQCSARLSATCPGGDPAENQNIIVTVHSYFAPSTHVRPEWWSSHPSDRDRFRGKENGGT
jgi:hypothetical protein